jgi:CRISPR-associated protein Cas2
MTNGPLTSDLWSEAMLTWVIYDISNDKSRGKIADRCLDIGLYRVQKSVFLGDLDSNRVDEVVLFSNELLSEATDSLYVFPMCRDDFDKCRIIGQGFDGELVSDDLLTKVI